MDGWREMRITHRMFEELGLDGVVIVMKQAGFLFDSEGCPVMFKGEYQIVPDDSGATYRQRIEQ